jgi:hypothetical protein
MAGSVTVEAVAGTAMESEPAVAVAVAVGVGAGLGVDVAPDDAAAVGITAGVGLTDRPLQATMDTPQTNVATKVEAASGRRCGTKDSFDGFSSGGCSTETMASCHHRVSQTKRQCPKWVLE